MKIRLYADIEVSEEAETVLIAEAIKKARINGGEPDGIDTLSEALVELFELTGADGLDLGLIGLSFLTIDTELRCNSPECNRKEHP